MQQYAYSEDPNYGSDVARFVRNAVQELIKYEVVPDRTLTDRLIQIDRHRQLIRVRPGQPFRRFHALVDRATLFVVGGISWAPEYHEGPRLHAIPAVPASTPFKPSSPIRTHLRVVSDLPEAME